MPPYEPIRDWVWLKRRSFGISGSGKAAEREVSRVAHFVRLAIFRRGIKERRYLRDALAQVFSNAQRTMRFYVDRLMKEIMGE
jgi:hypothetical protein